jgi:hypothetical protein
LSRLRCSEGGFGLWLGDNRDIVNGKMSTILNILIWRSEVTPGLLAGAEPEAHQFIVTICLKGDQMEENSEQHRINSETRPGMHERVRS